MVGKKKEIEGWGGGVGIAGRRGRWGIGGGAVAHAAQGVSDGLFWWFGVMLESGS